MLDVRNNFIRSRFTVKSRELKSALFNGHTSRAYRRTGMLYCNYVLLTKLYRLIFFLPVDLEIRQIKSGI